MKRVSERGMAVLLVCTGVYVAMVIYWYPISPVGKLVENILVQMYAFKERDMRKNAQEVTQRARTAVPIPTAQPSPEPRSIKYPAPDDFILGSFLTNDDCSLILMGDSRWFGASESEETRLYHRTPTKGFELLRTYRNEAGHSPFLTDWEDALFVSDRYVAVTFWPGKGSGGPYLSIFDLQEGVSLTPKRLFDTLPEVYSMQDVLLPPPGGGHTVVVTERSKHYSPIEEPIEYGGYPGDMVHVLDFETMSERTVTKPNPTTTLLPIGYATDGAYVLFQKDRLTLANATSCGFPENSDGFCVTCARPDGYSILSLQADSFTEVPDLPALDEWITGHGVVFEGYTEDYVRYEDKSCGSEVSAS